MAFSSVRQGQRHGQRKIEMRLRLPGGYLRTPSMVEPEGSARAPQRPQAEFPPRQDRHRRELAPECGRDRPVRLGRRYLGAEGSTRICSGVVPWYYHTTIWLTFG